jgi:O-antigen/teichoic acid export membrane protein
MATGGIRTNSVWSITNYGFSIISLFFLFPFMVHRLGDSNYGFFIFLGTINGMASIANFGFSEASLRFIAFYYNNKNSKALKKIFSTSFWTYLVLGTITIAVIILLAGLIFGLLKETNVDKALGIKLITISAVTFFIRFITGIFNIVPQALQRFDISSKIAISETLLRVGFYVAVLIFGYGLIGVVISEIFLAVIISFVNFIFSARLLGSFSLIGRPSAASFREIFNYSIIAFITQMVGLLWQYTDRILLGYFIGSAAIAYFSVPQQIIFKVLGLVAAASVVLFPRLSLDRLDNTAKILYKEFTFIGLMFTIIVFSTLSLVIKDFISLWISPSFASETKSIAVIFALSCMIRGAFPVYENLFKGIGKPVYNMYIIIASSLIIVLVDFLLIPRLGLNGAGIAYLVSPLAGVAAIILIWKRLLNESLTEPLKQYLIPLLISFIMVAVSFLIKSKLNISASWVNVFFQVLCFSIVLSLILIGYYRIFVPEIWLKMADLKIRLKAIWNPFEK